MDACMQFWRRDTANKRRNQSWNGRCASLRVGGPGERSAEPTLAASPNWRSTAAKDLGDVLEVEQPLNEKLELQLQLSRARDERWSLKLLAELELSWDGENRQELDDDSSSISSLDHPLAHSFVSKGDSVIL